MLLVQSIGCQQQLCQILSCFKASENRVFADKTALGPKYAILDAFCISHYPSIAYTFLSSRIYLMNSRYRRNVVAISPKCHRHIAEMSLPYRRNVAV